MRNLLVMNLEIGNRLEHVHQWWREFLARPESEPVPECSQGMAEPLFFNRQEEPGAVTLRVNLLCELWWDENGDPVMKANGSARENVVLPRREEFSTV